MARKSDPQVQQLHEALSAYGLHPRQLRDLARQSGSDLRQALRHPRPPAALTALLNTLTALFTPNPDERIKSPGDLAPLLITQLGHLDQEHMVVVCLDAKNHIQHIDPLYCGTLDTTQVRPAEVFKAAIRLNSRAIILAHNHPSGVIEPSDEDVLFTVACDQAGRMLDIRVLDHFIIGAGRWLSLADRGILPVRRD